MSSKQQQNGRWRRLGVQVGVVGAVLALVVTAGCAKSQREGGGSGDDGSTFVFAGTSDPTMLDPTLASDGETFRVTRQLYEGLVRNKPGTTEIQPALATSWEQSSDAKTFTFTLRDGVTFSDGTPFNADAVCANFNRWYHWKGLLQNENITYYWNNLFHGFQQSDDPAKVGGTFKECRTDGGKAVIELTTPWAGFLRAMVMPAFSMQSPTAMAKYKADDIGGTVDDPRFSEYATAHPTGTGPFVLERWDRNQQVVLRKNPNYWGEKASVDRVIIRTITDAKARVQELQAGTIDGFDLVAPADVEPLKAQGKQIVSRPPFNVFYLGLDQGANPALADLRVRQAIAHAINRDEIIKRSMPANATANFQFLPESVAGYNPDVPRLEYDPQKAKQLLAQAGQSGLTLKVAYPTGVTRPYMPSPEDSFVAIKSQLEAVGITVQDVTAKWNPEYQDMVQSEAGRPKRDAYIIGWTGDYDDPDNFIGIFFGMKKPDWGFDDPALFRALADAREIPDVAAQTAAYRTIETRIAELVPGVPISSCGPNVALAPGVGGFVPSPTTDEMFNTITVSR